MKITHKIFGSGWILEVPADGTARVDFGQNGVQVCPLRDLTVSLSSLDGYRAYTSYCSRLGVTPATSWFYSDTIARKIDPPQEGSTAKEWRGIIGGGATFYRGDGAPVSRVVGMLDKTNDPRGAIGRTAKPRADEPIAGFDGQQIQSRRDFAGESIKRVAPMTAGERREKQQRMSKRQRKLLKAYELYQEGYTWDEVADKMGEPRSVVRGWSDEIAGLVGSYAAYRRTEQGNDGRFVA